MNGGALALRSADLRMFDGEPRIADIRIAEALGFDRPRDIRKLISRNMARLERHGPIFSADERLRATVARSRAATIYYLNEKQAYRLCMWSEAPNADTVQEQMIEVFVAWKRGRLVEPERLQRSRANRKGRGRLSSIDMLPAECDEDVAWANEQLRIGRAPQTTILIAFNERLAAKACGPISKGAWSRYSVQLAHEIRVLDRTRGIVEEVLARLGPGDRGDSTVAACEALKARILDEISRTGEEDADRLRVLSLTLQRIDSTAQRAAKTAERERLLAGPSLERGCRRASPAVRKNDSDQMTPLESKKGGAK